MPSFSYRAIDAAGQIRQGVVEATSNAAAIPELEKLGLLPIEVKGATASGRSLRQLLSREPTREEITGITEDLASLIKGGVTLDRALLILSETSARPPIARLLDDLHRGIARGHSLAEVLAGHPAIFPRTYVKMVEVAEVAGTLDETLRVIAHERSRGEKLRRRITSALTYPAFLACAAVGVLVFVLMVIIPEFERALAGLGGGGEGSAQMVFGLSRALRANSTTFGMLAILALAAVLLASRSRPLKEASMRLLGRIPGVRQVMRLEQAVSFCATLGTLSRSGVDISSALRLIRDLMRDGRSAEKIDRLVASVRQGQRLSDGLMEQDLLPIYAVHMLRVGEESGELAAAATRIAGFYEERLDRALARLTSILGPSIMILVSLLIGWLIVSVITALLSVNEMIL